MTWAVEQIERVQELKGLGLSDREVSRQTAVPVGTIRTWRRRGLPRCGCPTPTCATCGAEPHDFTLVSAGVYAYLLGVYLGDGHLRRRGGGWALRISLDASYPAIVAECAAALEAISGKETRRRPHHRTENCLTLDSHWRCWPCYLPQHGIGRKHSRPIVLEPWQQRIVDECPGQFLRGLIHSDGWRGSNKVRAKGRDYEYPRYQFSNRSDDIRGLFTDACDRLGIEWKPWTRFHISVAKRESVALLDRFVGPKT